MKLKRYVTIFFIVYLTTIIPSFAEESSQDRECCYSKLEKDAQEMRELSESLTESNLDEQINFEDVFNNPDPRLIELVESIAPPDKNNKPTYKEPPTPNDPNYEAFLAKRELVKEIYGIKEDTKIGHKVATIITANLPAENFDFAQKILDLNKPHVVNGVTVLTPEQMAVAALQCPAKDPEKDREKSCAELVYDMSKGPKQYDCLDNYIGKALKSADSSLEEAGKDPFEECGVKCGLTSLESDIVKSINSTFKSIPKDRAVSKEETTTLRKEFEDKVGEEKLNALKKLYNTPDIEKAISKLIIKHIKYTQAAQDEYANDAGTKLLAKGGQLFVTGATMDSMTAPCDFINASLDYQLTEQQRQEKELWASTRMGLTALGATATGAQAVKQGGKLASRLKRVRQLENAGKEMKVVTAGTDTVFGGNGVQEIAARIPEGRMTDEGLEAWVQQMKVSGVSKEKQQAAVLKKLEEMGVCFKAGTLIQTPKGDIPIEKIKEGDFVVSKNLETGAIENKRVLETFTKNTPMIVKIVLKNGSIIEATPNHPFWVITNNKPRWINAGELKIGDLLITSDNAPISIKDIEYIAYDPNLKDVFNQTQNLPTHELPVYNFEVEDNHNYFVSNSHILVHNPPTCQANPVFKHKFDMLFDEEFSAGSRVRVKINQNGVRITKEGTIVEEGDEFLIVKFDDGGTQKIPFNQLKVHQASAFTFEDSMGKRIRSGEWISVEMKSNSGRGILTQQKEGYFLKESNDIDGKRFIELKDKDGRIIRIEQEKSSIIKIKDSDASTFLGLKQDDSFEVGVIGKDDNIPLTGQFISRDDTYIYYRTTDGKEGSVKISWLDFNSIKKITSTGDPNVVVKTLDDLLKESSFEKRFFDITRKSPTAYRSRVEHGLNLLQKDFGISNENFILIPLEERKGILRKAYLRYHPDVCPTCDASDQLSMNLLKEIFVDR